MPPVQHADVLILGAGIAGASAAYELAARARVIVLEREPAPGYHSTGRSAALFFESYGNATVRRLNRASRPFLEHPPAGFCEQPLVAPRGALYIARADQLERLEATLTELSASSPDVHRLPAGVARARVPVLRESYVAAAVLEPGAMDIDVAALHQGYLRGARTRGASVLTDAEARAISRTAGGWSVETRRGSFAAATLIDAAGAWCDEVARLAGVRPIGLVPMRRTAATFDPPADVDPSAWPLVIDVEEDLYFKPEAGRILFSPADETPVPPCDVQPEDIDIATAAARLEEATTLEVRRITHKWAGLRSFVPDRSLVIGMDGEADGFFWLAAQGGYGIQSAAAAARAAAGLLLDGRLPDDLLDLGLNAPGLSPSRLTRTGT